jgi:hypothetical protein
MEPKRDLHRLLRELGQEKPGRHLHCPFHEDRTGSFSIHENNGQWYWKCFAGCGEGTIIDALVKTRGLSVPEAFGLLAEESGEKTLPKPPELDLPRAERLVEFAHRHLLTSFDVQEQYAFGKRGFRDLEFLKRMRVGFISDITMREWPHWRLTGWILPITDEKGALHGVKLHREVRNDKGPKCLWLPFGKIEKKNGWPTLWPAPELWPTEDVMILAPGELKALVLAAAGIPATSPTVGEGQAVPAGLLRRIKAHTVHIQFDPDPTGRGWAEVNTLSLSRLGKVVRSYSCAPESPASDRETAPAGEFDDGWGITPTPAPEDPAIRILRDQLGEGRPGVWIEPDLSKADLRTLCQMQEVGDFVPPPTDWSINNRPPPAVAGVGKRKAARPVQHREKVAPEPRWILGET